MLRELAVQNLALIEDVRVELSAGFCAWTGETGAGKTLLLSALGLLLGDRCSTDILRSGAAELEAAQLRSGELADLQRERERLANAQALQAFAGSGCARLYDEEGSVVEQLGKLLREAQGWLAADPDLQEVVTRLHGVVSET